MKPSIVASVAYIDAHGAAKHAALPREDS